MTPLRISIVVSVGLATIQACGGGKVGAPPAPVAPPIEGPTLPPSVDVTGLWFGDLSDSSGPSKSVWNLTLEGNSVTGSATVTQCCARDGLVRIDDMPIAATLSATTFSFAATLLRPNCPVTLAGTADVASTTIGGSYSGRDCRGAIANGHVSLSKAVDLTGTWSGEMGAAVYHSRAVSWQLVESADVITGSISAWRENPSGPQSVTGTFSNTTSTLTFTSSYLVNRPMGGTCQETFNGTAKLSLTYIVPNFRPPIPNTPTAELQGAFTGGNCESPTFITNGALHLTKQ